MTRGAQRERDRLKAEKRAKANAGKVKASDKGSPAVSGAMSAVARKERDAQIMREKQAAAVAAKPPAS